MPVDPSTFKEYEGKSVILHRQTGDGLEELEGKIEAASEGGIAFKEKGRRDPILILPTEVEELDFAPETPKKITQKTLKAVTENTVRQHLVDRHGMTRPEANKINDEEAWEIHEKIDHKDLGHKHEVEEVEDDEVADDEDIFDEDE